MKEGMNEAQIAWAAGIYEGEGCAYTNGVAIRIKLTMCDEDIVRRWGATIGVGRFNGPYQPRSGGKPFYEWSVCKYHDVVRVYEMFKPWLGLRRTEQFERVVFCREPPKMRTPAGPDCGFYKEPVPCTRGYFRHRARGESACLTCRASRVLYGTQGPEARADRASSIPKLYFDIVDLMKKKHGDEWTEKWPDYVPWTVDGSTRRREPTAEPGEGER